MGEDTYEAVRHTHGDNPHTSGTWISFPTDTSHHESIAGVEGFEHARLAVRRLTGSRRRVYDITTTAQCFIAEGLVVHNCDYVINIKLVDDNKDGFARMTGPLTMGCLDEKYRGWDSAMVFADCTKQDQDQDQDQDQGGEGQDQGQGFDDHDWDGAKEMSDDEVQALAREIDGAIRQGAMAAGKTGSGGDRMFDELMQPQQDWRDVLRDFVTTTCAGRDYSTWQRPSRRYIGAGYYMPSGISEQIGEIVIAPDMSGSTFAPGVLPRMMSEIKGIVETVKPEAVRLLYWDTAICGDERYETHELDNLIQTTKPKGGGGTMLECVPAHMTKNNIKAQCAVVFTDGYLGGTWGHWDCPVLWVIVDNKRCQPPFGTTVHVNTHNL